MVNELGYSEALLIYIHKITVAFSPGHIAANVLYH